MSGSGNSVRDTLAGKELIGFTNSSPHGDRTVRRASSAKVTVKPIGPADGTKKPAPDGGA